MTNGPIDERGVASGPQDPARPAPATTAVTGRRSLLRRVIDRVTATSEQVEAQELLEQTIDRGSTPVLSCISGERVSVSGTIRALTLRPVGGVQALEADLFDGSGTLTVIWLGRNRIPGIDPGRSISVHGRLTRQRGRAVMFNPAYELRS